MREIDRPMPQDMAPHPTNDGCGREISASSVIATALLAWTGERSGRSLGVNNPQAGEIASPIESLDSFQYLPRLVFLARH